MESTIRRLNHNSKIIGKVEGLQYAIKAMELHGNLDDAITQCLFAADLALNEEYIDPSSNADGRA